MHRDRQARGWRIVGRSLYKHVVENVVDVFDVLGLRRCFAAVLVEVIAVRRAVVVAVGERVVLAVACAAAAVHRLAAVVWRGEDWNRVRRPALRHDRPWRRLRLRRVVGDSALEGEKSLVSGFEGVAADVLTAEL